MHSLRTIFCEGDFFPLCTLSSPDQHAQLWRVSAAHAARTRVSQSVFVLATRGSNESEIWNVKSKNGVPPIRLRIVAAHWAPLLHFVANALFRFSTFPLPRFVTQKAKLHSCTRQAYIGERPCEIVYIFFIIVLMHMFFSPCHAFAIFIHIHVAKYDLSTLPNGSLKSPVSRTKL